MALFDNDFIETIVTEGKDCDKDCKKDKDVDEEKDEKEEDVEDVDDDAEEELSDDDKEEAEEAARFDVEEASSIDAMKGFSSALSDMARESHFTCLEFVGTTIALDKVDVACSESYVKASSIDEKEAVTEEFKENVKLYAQKFKAFILKIKNIVVRFYNRAKNYIVNLFDKVRAKIVSFKVKEIDTEALNKSDKKVKTFTSIKTGETVSTLTSRMGKLWDMYAGDVEDILTMPSTASEDQIAKAKEKLENFAKLSKNEIREKVLGTPTEVELKTFNKALSDLNDAKNAVKSVDEVRSKIMTAIKDAEKSVNGSKDINSAVMATKVTTINKLVGFMNKLWAVFGTAIHHWLSPRISVVMRYGKRQWKKGNESAAAPKADDKKETKGTNESWSLLDQFNAEW